MRIEDQERINANNIMDNSVLTIHFINAQNIVNQYGQQTNAYFQLCCEGQKEETGISDNPQYFEINKEFTFNIKTGEEPLEIRMIDSNNMENYQIDAYYDVNFQDLRE